ncbi:hypothetical protein MPTK1_5g18390 [Marchantia polymorpha subsp. ruderalis]|uniref:Uncharacterized protein n=2 Tax=Marchantia polymorpha TaxID=3197 RepID=A0AAF6BJQ3_MARPO|nr:hypothetical protein MARPO_0084s0087 [Marchantia polymorpha]BBN12237.1 hypothetical protein Mp_5g18390 [Marchantia polymorpha subsp. ruderalis]|eukprot:PTQ34025.1 hypothetical protein MARPO_0084s0087 [Marchantia polymorpha]
MDYGSTSPQSSQSKPVDPCRAAIFDYRRRPDYWRGPKSCSARSERVQPADSRHEATSHSFIWKLLDIDIR